MTTETLTIYENLSIKTFSSNKLNLHINSYLPFKSKRIIMIQFFFYSKTTAFLMVTQKLLMTLINLVNFLTEKMKKLYKSLVNMMIKLFGIVDYGMEHY